MFMLGHRLSAPHCGGGWRTGTEVWVRTRGWMPVRCEGATRWDSSHVGVHFPHPRWVGFRTTNPCPARPALPTQVGLSLLPGQRGHVDRRQWARLRCRVTIQAPLHTKLGVCLQMQTCASVECHVHAVYGQRRCIPSYADAWAPATLLHAGHLGVVSGGGYKRP